MEIFREFTFEAAHRLPLRPGRAQVRAAARPLLPRRDPRDGPGGGDAGWVMDFADIKAAFAPLHDQLDHRYLNEVDGLDNPTSENLARWIWDRLVGRAPLSAVTVRETCTSGCTYRGVAEA